MRNVKRTTLVIKAIAWTTRARSGWITTLDHEATNHTVESRFIIKTVASQENKIVHRNWRLGGKQLNLDIAFDRMQNRCVFLILIDLHRGRIWILSGQEISPLKIRARS